MPPAVSRLAILTALLLPVAVPLASAAELQPIGSNRMVSRDYLGHPGGQDFDASLSSTGRFVAFLSYSRLVQGESCYACVYVRDRRLRTTEVVASTGGSYGNPDISGDGRFVSFEAIRDQVDPSREGSERDLVTSGHLHGGTDVTGTAERGGGSLAVVYVRDRATGLAEVVSRTRGGKPATDSAFSSISEDGRFVAFCSENDGIVAGDTNGSDDVFVVDLQTGKATMVSRTPDGDPANDHSYLPSISADGTRVAFVSNATDLAPGDTNGTSDVFVHDLTTGTTTLASHNAAGSPASGTSYLPSLSADGKHVAFASRAADIVSGDDNGAYDVFVLDLSTGSMTLVSKAMDGTVGSTHSSVPAISADGARVAFESSASDLIGGVSGHHVYVRDLSVGVTSLVSHTRDGLPGDGPSYEPAISEDGHTVAFDSYADDLVRHDRRAQNVFRYRLD